MKLSHLLFISLFSITVSACSSGGGNSGTDGGTNPEGNTSSGTDDAGDTGTDSSTDTDGGDTGTDGSTDSDGGDTGTDGSTGTDGETDSDGSTDNSNDQCSIANVNQWVDDGMRDYYFYYDQVPQLDLTQYDSPEVLIRDLRVSPDRFSYVTDAAEQDQLFEEGMSFGYGFRLVRLTDGTIKAAAVFTESPAQEAGLLRGDVILAVNGTDIADMTNQLWTEYLGESGEVRSPVFTVERADGTRADVQITSGEYRLYTVQSARYFTVTETGQRVGYLNFLSYLGTAREELDAVMQWFDENEVSELVLDLRFNGGGYTSIARQIGSQVAGETVFNEIAERLSFNDKYSEFNYERNFRNEEITLSLPRLYVLTSGSTASASELTINALRPYIDVFTVGNLTVGKPFASRGRDFCGKRMQAVELLSTNANGASVINGISADCEVFDSFDGVQGSFDDNMMETALGYIVNGTCATTPQAQARRGLSQIIASDAIGSGSVDDQ